jgi:hypothetical protein
MFFDFKKEINQKTSIILFTIIWRRIPFINVLKLFKKLYENTRFFK